MIYRFCKFCIWLLALVFYRHKVYGKERIVEGGGIVASNHCSFLDPPLIGISYPGKIHYLARDTLYNFRPFGWLLAQLNTHPVHRGGGNLQTLKMAMDFVQNGKKVLIFPEGKRSSDGQIKPGQLGIGMLVQRTQCRIFPVYIHGTFEIWNNQQKFPKITGHTATVFGTPIDYSPLENQDKKEAQARIVNEIMDKITELRDWYLAGAVGSPP